MPGVAITALTDNADAVAAGSVGGVSIDRLTGFNGASYDRIRTLGGTSLLGLGQLSISPAIPGASAVKATRKVTVSNSGTRVTLVTPTSGKKIRVIGVSATNSNATGSNFSFYFGSGAQVTTDVTKHIAELRVEADTTPGLTQVFPDGGGPVGAADEVVSMITGANISGAGVFSIVYREE